MTFIFEIEGNRDERFILTRDQVQRLVTSSYRFGENMEPMQRTFEAEDNICGFLGYAIKENRRQFERLAGANARVAWLERLNRVTASHLRKARAELHDLRLDNEYAHAELRLWRGSEHRKCDTPGHYAGDGYVTCSRAMESASVQDEVVPQSAMQLWWWMCAFKYVWRMWSKADPVADAEKAIDCLEHDVHTIEDGKSGDSDE